MYSQNSIHELSSNFFSPIHSISRIHLASGPTCSSDQLLVRLLWVQRPQTMTPVHFRHKILGKKCLRRSPMGFVLYISITNREFLEQISSNKLSGKLVPVVLLGGDGLRLLILDWKPQRKTRHSWKCMVSQPQVDSGVLITSPFLKGSKCPQYSAWVTLNSLAENAYTYKSGGFSPWWFTLFTMALPFSWFSSQKPYNILYCLFQYSYVHLSFMVFIGVFLLREFILHISHLDIFALGTCGITSYRSSTIGMHNSEPNLPFFMFVPPEVTKYFLVSLAGRDRGFQIDLAILLQLWCSCFDTLFRICVGLLRCRELNSMEEIGSGTSDHGISEPHRVNADKTLDNLGFGVRGSENRG